MRLNLKAIVCELDHGGPCNSANVYGHHGSPRVCTRVGKSDTWVYGITRAKATRKTAPA